MALFQIQSAEARSKWQPVWMNDEGADVRVDAFSAFHALGEFIDHPYCDTRVADRPILRLVGDREVMRMWVLTNEMKGGIRYRAVPC